MMYIIVFLVFPDFRSDSQRSCKPKLFLPVSLAGATNTDTWWRCWSRGSCWLVLFFWILVVIKPFYVCIKGHILFSSFDLQLTTTCFWQRTLEAFFLHFFSKTHIIWVRRILPPTHWHHQSVHSSNLKGRT